MCLIKTLIKRSKVVVLTALLPLALILTSCSAPKSNPAPAPEPEEEFAYHKIKYSGETVAVISAWYTKSAKNWPEIVDANPKMVPSKLRIGDYVRIPKRLISRNSSLPQDFVASFKSGVNKDSSKGEIVKPTDESPTSSNTESPMEDAPYNSKEPTTKMPSVDSSDYVMPNEPSSVEMEPAGVPDSKPMDTSAPDLLSESAAPSAPEPANDENQKIREQLMQELLQ